MVGYKHQVWRVSVIQVTVNVGFFIIMFFTVCNKGEDKKVKIMMINSNI